MDFCAYVTVTVGPLLGSASVQPAAAPLQHHQFVSSTNQTDIMFSNTGTLAGAGETAKTEETKPESADPSGITARDYRKYILSHKMKLIVQVAWCPRL